jgi:hypothetical protein
MKKDLLFGLGFYAVLFLVACSAEHHLRKFHQKGGEITPRIELVEYTDTIKVNGKDSVIVVKIPVTCPEVKVPEPKWRTKLEYRYKYKIHRDTIRLMRTETKYKYKTVKATNKPSRWWVWLMIGFVLNWILRNLWYYLTSRFLI